VRAIDTNVIVRFLTHDDKRQTDAARAAISAGDIVVAATMHLEAEWVLRSAYSFEPTQIADSFQGLGACRRLPSRSPQGSPQAIGWMRQGMDFADALHLAEAEGCSVLLSFDQKLSRLATT